MAKIHTDPRLTSGSPRDRLIQLIGWAETELDAECDRQYLIEHMLDRLDCLANDLPNELSPER
jgi:hypothetical protein